MVYQSKATLDRGLEELLLVDRFDATTQECVDQAERDANTLGNAAVTVTGPNDEGVNDRNVVVGTIAANAATATGTASHYVLSQGNTVLWSGPLASAVGFTSGQDWSKPATHKIIAVAAT